MSNPNWTTAANRHANRNKKRGVKIEGPTRPTIVDANGNYPNTEWDITATATTSPNPTQ